MPEFIFTMQAVTKVHPPDKRVLENIHLAFYPGRVDVAWMGDERVQAQASDFYGGWITADLVGPFKGPPETLGW